MQQADSVKSKTTSVKGKCKGVPSHQPITWTENHQQLIEKLLNCLVEPQILAFPDFSKPFVLHTDASNQGLLQFYIESRQERCFIASL